MSPLKARASTFIDSNVLPTILAALETYAYDDAPEALARAKEALTRDLTWELESVCRQLIDQTFERQRT
jgi:hypothetical protein